MAGDPELKKETDTPSPSNVPRPLSPQEEQVGQGIQEDESDKDDEFEVCSSPSSSSSSYTEPSLAPPCRFQIPRADAESDKRSGGRASRARRLKVCSRPLWCSSVSLSASFRRVHRANANAMKARMAMRARRHMMSQNPFGFSTGPVPTLSIAPVPAHMLWIDYMFEKMSDTQLIAKRELRSAEELPEEAQEQQSTCKICEKKEGKKEEKKLVVSIPVPKERVHRQGRCVVKMSLYARRRQKRKDFADRKCMCSGYRYPKRRQIFEKEDTRANWLDWLLGQKKDPPIKVTAKTRHHEKTFFKDKIAKVNRRFRPVVVHFEIAAQKHNLTLEQIRLGDKLRREWLHISNGK